MARVCQTCTSWWVLVIVTILAIVTPPAVRAQLSPAFYASSCPNLQAIASSGLSRALGRDRRVGASILRLHFHDCFVQGCDASVLLSDTGGFVGEQNAGPNANSLRGFSTVNSIKASVEAACPSTVSCAGLLALLARDAVVAAGGPSWTVQFGRRDGTTASFGGANNNLPSPNFHTGQLTSQFGAVGLSQTDMVALAGAHTFGRARCTSFSNRLTGAGDPTLNPAFLASLQRQCPQGGNPNKLVNMDGTATRFDNSYYRNLPNGQGLFTSDEALQTDGGSTAGIVAGFAANQGAWFGQFAASMVKMGNIGPLTGSAGEIRKVCSKTN